MAETIFDKIIDKSIPAEILYEDELALAFSDINPQAPVHFLVIPKKQIATINDITEADREVVGHLYFVAAKLAAEKGFADQGYRAVMNCNEYGGQTVYHIHLHVLAGKPMGWPPYTDKMKPLEQPLTISMLNSGSLIVGARNKTKPLKQRLRCFKRVSKARVT